MIFRYILFTFFLPFLVPSFLAAQESETRVLRLRCISFQVDGRIPELFAHSVPQDDEPDEGVAVEVRTYLNHEYLRLPMKGDRIAFTTDLDAASVNDEEKLVARLKLSDGLRPAILMFLPGDGQEGSLKYRVMAIEDTVGEFPRGSLKVMNLSPAPIRLMLEEEKFDFRSGDVRLIDDMPVGERNSAAMKAFIFAEGKWIRIGAGIWPHPGEKRVLQIAFYNPKSRNIEVRGIRDIAVRDEVGP